MAKAPRPGTSPTAAKKKKAAQQRGFRITVWGEVADIYPADIGPRDDALVRHETGKALGYNLTLLSAIQDLEGDADQLGMDTVCLLWWWGRRKAGDTTESLAEAFDRFPTVGELEEACQLDRIVPDEEGEEGDPLPSDGD